MPLLSSPVRAEWRPLIRKGDLALPRKCAARLQSRAPLPGMASKFLGCRGFAPRRFAPLTMALAIGCSESASTDAASLSTSSSLAPATAATPENVGVPRVSVPVLSKITTSRSRDRSSASRSFTSKPFLAPSEVEIAITSGIAKPSACGHAMISTVALLMSAWALSPTNHQYPNVSTPEATAT
jgi:hypothetical protein